MTYKKDFIKRERVDATKEKGYYSDIKVIKEPPLRKDETFVLMFRDFTFFDVKSYECRNGDVYIRNIVDGTILKRYFRMDGDDQLTVFKNRMEFDEFMKKVEEKGYLLGPEKSIQSNADNLSGSINNERIKKMTDEASRQYILDSYESIDDADTGEIVAIRSLWDGKSFTRNANPLFFNKVAEVLAEDMINKKLGRNGGMK